MASKEREYKKNIDFEKSLIERYKEYIIE